MYIISYMKFTKYGWMDVSQTINYLISNSLNLCINRLMHTFARAYVNSYAQIIPEIIM
jgi:hypothetical protein